MPKSKIGPTYRLGKSVKGYTRGPPKRLYVDRDFQTRAKFRDGQLNGRSRTSRYDTTAPIRDSQGRIFGRSPAISRNSKSVKTARGKLNVREVGK